MFTNLTYDKFPHWAAGSHAEAWLFRRRGLYCPGNSVTLGKVWALGGRALQFPWAHGGRRNKRGLWHALEAAAALPACRHTGARRRAPAGHLCHRPSSAVGAGNRGEMYHRGSSVTTCWVPWGQRSGFFLSSTSSLRQRPLHPPKRPSGCVFSTQSPSRLNFAGVEVRR